MITTEYISNFDACNRLAIYAKFDTPRISLATVLNEALRIGLLSGNPVAAKTHLMQRAANPGLAIYGSNVYSSAVHHSALIELIVTYLLAGEGAWKSAPAVEVGPHQYQPLSYLLPDHRLRRIILCSQWNEQRRLEEVNSWRTLGDIIATNRPMLINAIVIGAAASGFRPSVWSRAYEHPVHRGLRVRSIAKEDGFNNNWRKVYRESSAKSCQDWLTIMQNDNAFADTVFSTVVDTPHISAQADFPRLLDGVASGRDEMRRSHCFRQSTCPYVYCCHHDVPVTPAEAGWREKETLLFGEGVGK